MSAKPEGQLLACCVRNDGRSEWVFTDAAGDAAVAISDTGFVITSISGKGRGVVAVKPFAPGDCIFSESPLIRWSSADEGSGSHVSSAWLQKKLTSMPQADVAAFASLFASPAHAAYGPAMAIWLSNAYPADQVGNGDGSAVYRVTSRFNHACAPSCVTSWNMARREFRLHAIKSIAPGEEITVNYLGPECHVLSREARMAELRRRGFECACATCAQPVACAVSDARRAQMATLRQQLEQEHHRGAGGAPYEHCESLFHELMRLMRDEGLPEVLAHDAIFHLMVKAWKTGHRNECIRWTKRWLPCVRTMGGEDSDITSMLVEALGIEEV